MKVLVISAHPDDETLGVGGSILRHVASGDQVFWLIVTTMSEESGYDSKKVQAREEEIESVSRAYGFSEIIKFDYPTATLSSSDLPSLISRLSKTVSEIQPNVIYTLNRSDVHSDHRIIFEAVNGSTKSFRHSYIQRVLMYECISETEFAAPLQENAFIPNYFVDITPHLERKIEIMKIYKSELGVHPFPRSEENIRAFATIRGATCGARYAEAFQLLKFIER